MKKFVLLFFIVIITDFKCFSQFVSLYRSNKHQIIISEGQATNTLKEKWYWIKIVNNTATPQPQKRSYIIFKDTPFSTKNVQTSQLYYIYSVNLTQDGDSHYYTKSESGQEVEFTYYPNGNIQYILMKRYSTNGEIVKKVWYYLD